LLTSNSTSFIVPTANKIINASNTFDDSITSLFTNEIQTKKSKRDKKLIGTTPRIPICSYAIQINISPALTSTCAPIMTMVPNNSNVITIGIDVLCYTNISSTIESIITSLVQSALLQLSMIETMISSIQPSSYSIRPYHFCPPSLCHAITLLYHCVPNIEQTKPSNTCTDEYIPPLYQTTTDQLYEKQRQLYHEIWMLPCEPLLRTVNEVCWQPIVDSRLLDVHHNIPSSGLVDSNLHLVRGSYAYHHYMQDKFNDNGWGCAYRTLQSICSWYNIQKYTNVPIPTHTQIQQLLVDLNDKETSFVGSREWIGAIEVGLILKHMYGITCKTLFITSGSEVNSYARQLAAHFDTHGTPVMIGGGVLAYGLLGIDWNSATGEVSYLILDPHYTGCEDMKTIIKNGWCGWKNSSLFLSSHFYNFCLPQRPQII
jgi:hypothetical protein